jgi:hypothetical protein
MKELKNSELSSSHIGVVIVNGQHISNHLPVSNNANNRSEAGSLKMNTALEYSTRVVQEGGRRCKKSTLNDLVHLTPLRIPLMNPTQLSVSAGGEKTIPALKIYILRDMADSIPYFVPSLFQESIHGHNQSKNTVHSPKSYQNFNRHVNESMICRYIDDNRMG